MPPISITGEFKRDPLPIRDETKGLTQNPRYRPKQHNKSVMSNEYGYGSLNFTRKSHVVVLCLRECGGGGGKGLQHLEAECGRSTFYSISDQYNSIMFDQNIMNYDDCDSQQNLENKFVIISKS